jgi:energy-coupling factor transport system permease protein
MSEFEFLRSMPFAEFTPRNTWLQRIDPRAFLLSFFLFLACVLYIQTIPALLAILGLILIGMFFSRVPLRVYFRGMLAALPFVLIIAVINLFFNTAIDKEPIYFQWRFITLSYADFRVAVILIIRFAAMILLISVVSSSLSTSRFIHGMESLLGPLKILRIPILDFIIAVEIAIRFIPILTITAERIAKAQASRGAVWGSGSGTILSRVKQVVPLLVPLFVQSLHKAESLALAMDSRGFGVQIERSSYIRSHFSWTDMFFLCITAILLVLIIRFG